MVHLWYTLLAHDIQREEIRLMAEIIGLPENISLTDLAKELGITYTAIKKRFDKVKTNNPALLDGHYFIEGKRTIMLDSVAKDIISELGKEKRDKVVIEDGRVDELNEEVAKLKNELSEREQEIARLKQMITQKYVLLEDHAKTEEELKLKSERLEFAEEKLKDANKAKDEMEKKLTSKEGLLKKIADRNKEQEQEIEDGKKELASVTAEKADLSKEIKKLKEEMAELEKARDEASREAEENLHLGFFARLRKKKEKKNGIQ